MATRNSNTAPTVEEVFPTKEELERQRAVALAAQQAQQEEELSPEDRVKAMLADMRDDERAVVKIYRRGPANKIYWCDDIPVIDFEAGGFPLIKQRFGPGEYEIRVYGSGGVKTKANINIYDTSGMVPASNPIPQQAPQQNELAQAMRLMIENQQRMMETINNRPQVDPMAQMTQMMTMMGAMRQAFGNDSAKSSIGEIVAAIKELKAVSSEINPPAESDKEPSLMQLAGQMLPMVQQMLPRRQDNPAQPLPQLAVPASMATAPMPAPEIDPRQMELPNINQPAPQQPDETEMNALQKLGLMNLLNKLIAMAQNNTDKQTAVDLIHEKAPDEVVEFLDTDGIEWWQVLSQVVPAVIPHREYFFAVQKMFRDSLEDEPEEKQ